MISVRKGQGTNPVLAEIKVHSPMYGDLLKKRSEIDILRTYESCGVAGISYITAPKFKGSIDVLTKICENTDLPVLRKDFILSANDIEETASTGAGGVLLIARMLRDETAEFSDLAFEHGLEPLVEVHTVEDVGYANMCKAKIVLINNRDISKFELDKGNVEVTESLCEHIERNRLVVSASGICSVEDADKALRKCDAILVGTAFMQAEDMMSFVTSFVGEGRC